MQNPGPPKAQEPQLPAQLMKSTHKHPIPWRVKAELFQTEDTQQAGVSGQGWGTWKILAAPPCPLHVSEAAVCAYPALLPG